MKRINIFVLLCLFVFGVGTTMALGAAEDLRTQLSKIEKKDGVQTITLAGDDATTFAGENNRLIILTVSTDLIIDGGGYTIKGSSDYGLSNNHGLVISGDCNLTIKNLKFTEFGNEKNVNAAGFDAITPIWTYLDFTGTLTLENVSIDKFNRTAVKAHGGKLVLKNCYIEGRYTASSSSTTFQNGVQILSADVTISGTTIINMGSKMTAADSNSAGCVELTFGVDADNSTIPASSTSTVIEGDKFTGQYGVIVSEKNSGVVTIKGGEFNAEVKNISVEAGLKAEDVVKIVGGKFSMSASTKEELEGLLSNDEVYSVKSDDTNNYWLVTGATITKSGDQNVVTVNEGSSASDVAAVVKDQEQVVLAAEEVAKIDKLDSAGLASILSDAGSVSEIDLSEAPETLTSVDLTSVKTSIDSLPLEGNKYIENIALSSTSQVKEIKATGATALESLDLAANTYIETVNVSMTKVTKLDAAGCSGLKTLNTKGAPLTEIILTNCTELADLDCSASGDQGQIASLDVTACTKLTNLSVKGNRLMVLDLSKAASLTPASTDVSGQIADPNKAKFGRSSRVSFVSLLRTFFNSFLAADNDPSSEAAKITKAEDLSDSSNTATVTNGVAVFTSEPKGNIKYYYNTKEADKGSVSFETADVDEAFLMDVTVEGGEATPEETGGSGGGCEMGLGLWALAALAAFAKLTKKL